jgi:hypothetical protein
MRTRHNNRLCRLPGLPSASTKVGGDENGSNLRSTNYCANSLNQHSGRATEAVMNWFTLNNGDQVGWTGFQPGNLRIRLTEKITKEMLSEFQGYVRDHAKPCGECRKAFLGNQ